MTVIECAAANDLALRLNHELKAEARLDGKLVLLCNLKENPPDFSKFQETSIPSTVETVKSKKLRQVQPFNYPNPSDVNTAWLIEKEQRQL